ncbi:MAG: TAXI family TRAP transporter solute-binding subunit [candidate division KSB1 bacterium]|nr:TAXI family TRAP transporter solute-binding subunit [candidate division KSB1 bacterium]MDZ7375417.1 TAXI family TRAP transporter solute-binding subunit [candidate division KSB1 bacterium]
MQIKSDRFFFVILLALVTIFQTGCEKHRRIYLLASGPPGTSYYRIGKNLAEVVSNYSRIKIEAVTKPVVVDGDTLPLNAQNNCRILSRLKVDFAISQNDVTLIPVAGESSNNFNNLQSIIPLFPEILFIFYKENLKPNDNSLAALIRGRTVTMGPEGSGEARLTKKVFQEFGIGPYGYQARHVNFDENVLSDSVDLCCMVTGFDNPRVQKSMERGGKIFSLGDPDLAGKGSEADGFCLKYPLAKPLIIPKNIYSNLPEHPILTVAIDAVLLTRKDMDPEVVHEVIETILNRKQHLVMDLDNKLLSQISEQFDPLKLRFPLHPGARHYLERDKPSFYERYAELIGVIFSIFLALVSGIVALSRWSQRRKKNRIDDYYKQVLDIQVQIDDFDDEHACRLAIARLKDLREKAFQHLIAEKLMADDSFRIFITLVNDTRSEIHQRLSEIRQGN